MAWTVSGWYSDTLKLALALDIALDLERDDHKLALYSNSLTPDFSATAPAYSTTAEVSGTGYTAGGAVITGTTLASTGGYTTWDGDNVEWASSTLSGVRGANAYADALGTNNLILGVDFGSAYETADGSLIVAWAGTGIGRIHVVP
ncbi:hypothetical protein [Streptosporangium sp. NPDC002721]|uniref:hypothetical protein n=1 Tax=Streptosporangium sp. NPDC002721 TaxID=3366188 RepID=UPI0036C3D754